MRQAAAAAENPAPGGRKRSTRGGGDVYCVRGGWPVSCLLTATVAHDAQPRPGAGPARGREPLKKTTTVPRD